MSAPMVSPQIAKLTNLLRPRTMVLPHINADPDAFAAAQGMRELALTLRPEIDCQVVAVGGVNTPSKKMAQALSLDYVTEPPWRGGALILVDCSTLDQTGVSLGELNPETLIAVDHHNPRPLEGDGLLVVDPEASSSCEVVYRLYLEAGHRPSHPVAQALLAGAASDSKGFSIGGRSLFQMAADLLGEKDISQVLGLISVDVEPSEKVARLKSAQRAELWRIDRWVVATSYVGSFEASAARALVSLGADVAVVVNESKSGSRVSMRSTQGFHASTGVNLGLVAQKLAEGLGGTGNGHPTAAGYNGPGTYQEVKNEVQKILEELISPNTPG